MTPGNHLHIATRLHFALLRHFDANVEVAELLQGGTEAREALWVCEASGDAGLQELGRQFATANQAAAATARSAATGRPAPQDADWARNTSGFGVSQIAETVQALPAATPAGLRSKTWFRRAAPRSR